MPSSSLAMCSLSLSFSIPNDCERCYLRIRFRYSNLCPWIFQPAACWESRTRLPQRLHAHCDPQPMQDGKPPERLGQINLSHRYSHVPTHDVRTMEVFGFLRAASRTTFGASKFASVGSAAARKSQVFGRTITEIARLLLHLHRDRRKSLHPISPTPASRQALAHQQRTYFVRISYPSSPAGAPRNIFDEQPFLGRV